MRLAAAILVLSSSAAAMSTTDTTTSSTGRAASPRRNLLDTSGVSPKSPLITAAEWITFLSTEVGEEFEVGGAHATRPELSELAEAVWAEASRFEYARAIRDGAEETAGPGGVRLYPFLICDGGGGGGGEAGSASESRAERTGYARRRRVSEAVRAAAAATDIALPEDGAAPYEVLINDRDVWCGYGLLNGIVAEAVEVDGVVQPIIMSMKMARNTVDKLMEQVEEFYNATGRTEEAGGVEEGNGDEGGGPEQRFLRNLQEDSEGGVAPDEPVMGLPEPVKNIVFPSATISLCPGALSEEVYTDLREQAVGETTDLTAEMTAWLLERVGAGAEIVEEMIKENVFWSNRNMKEQGWQPTERGQLWDDALAFAYQDDACRSTFQTMLRWETRMGPTYDSLHALIVTVETTNAESIDTFCVIGMLAGLAINPKVCQLEITPQQTVANDNAQWLTQTGVKNERPFFDVGLDGTGQVVAVSDTGVDRDSCYFGDSTSVGVSYTSGNDKFVLYDDYVNSNDYQYGHGTHVAGSVLGNREDGQGIGQGMAPGAKLAFIDIGFDNGALSLPSDSRLLGTGRLTGGQGPEAHIHSASWGVVGENGYNYQCRSFDSYMYTNDDFLILVAAGNDGRYDSRNSVSAPSTFKNGISVGASHSTGDDLSAGMLGPAYVADFSSRGPTADNRIKPDLVAPGKYIVSAGALPNTFGECDDGRPRPGNGKGGLTSMMGTSMATPITAGTAAIVRQYLEEGWYADGTKNSGASIVPSAALLKVILINGSQMDMKAVDNSEKSAFGTSVTDVQPYDDAQGFGHISLTNSVYLKGLTDVQIQFWDNEVVNYNGLRRFNIKIDKSNGCSNARLSVTLGWTDPPASMNCLRCLVNDLDLTVTKDGDTSGKIYYPNDLDSRDSLNNVERVIVQDVEDRDEFTITVDAFNLDTFSQNFALVATGCFGGIANTIDTSKNAYATDNSEDTRTRNIIIIVCSAAGFCILACAIALCRKKKRGQRGRKNYTMQ